MFNLILTELRPIVEDSSRYAISIGKIQITWYAIIILSGAIIGSCIGYYVYAKRLKFSSDLLFEGLSWGLILGFLGARILYVLGRIEEYHSLWEVINVRNGGLSIFGAMLLVIPFLFLFCKKKKIKIIVLVEIALPLILFAQVVGRWGNFINQEAYGRLVNADAIEEVVKEAGYASLNDAPMDFLNDTKYDYILEAQREALRKSLVPNFVINRMYIYNDTHVAGFSINGYYQPTFFYESVLNLIGIVLYMVLRRYIKYIYVGDGLSFYLIWYGSVRTYIESLRSDPLGFLGMDIRLSQVIAIAFIVIGITLLILRRVFKYKPISCYEALHAKGATMMEEDDIEEKNSETKVENDKND